MIILDSNVMSAHMGRVPDYAENLCANSIRF